MAPKILWSIKMVTCKNFPNLFQPLVSLAKTTQKKPLSKLLNKRIQEFLSFLLDPWKLRKELNKLLVSCSKTAAFGKEISVGTLSSVKLPKSIQNLTLTAIMLLSSKKLSKFLPICLILCPTKNWKNWLTVNPALASDQSWSRSLAYLSIFYFQIHTHNQITFGTQWKEFSTSLLPPWITKVSLHS